jgi:hypothetical protein
VNAGEVHNDGVNAAQQGGAVQGRDHSGEDEAVPNFPVRRGDGAEERTVVGGDRGEAVRGEGMGWLTGGVSLSAVRGRERGRGWRRVASGDSLSAGVVARAEWAGGGPRGGEVASARGGGGVAAGVGRESAQPGGERFLFFPISISILYPFLLNN